MNIYELAKKANEACELNNSDTRFWVDDGRYFICYNAKDEMDDIDEVSKKKFINSINKILGL